MAQFETPKIHLSETLQAPQRQFDALVDAGQEFEPPVQVTDLNIAQGRSFEVFAKIDNRHMEQRKHVQRLAGQVAFKIEGFGPPNLRTDIRKKAAEIMVQKSVGAPNRQAQHPQRSERAPQRPPVQQQARTARAAKPQATPRSKAKPLTTPLITAENWGDPLPVKRVGYK